MILVSKISLVAIGCLQGAQEAPDLPLAVATTGTGLAHLGGHVGAQNQLPMHFLAQDHLWVSVLFCYLPVGVISNHLHPLHACHPLLHLAIVGKKQGLILFASYQIDRIFFNILDLSSLFLLLRASPKTKVVHYYLKHPMWQFRIV